MGSGGVENGGSGGAPLIGLLDKGVEKLGGALAPRASLAVSFHMHEIRRRFGAKGQS